MTEPDFPRLESERLCLRPYEESDLEELSRLFSEPSVRRYLFDDLVWPQERVLAAIRSTRALFAEEGLGQWVVCERSDSAGRIVGFCGMHYFFEPPLLQLLYGLHPDVTGRGYATEASVAVMRHVFESCGMEQVVAATDPPNGASVAVMKRLGMPRDGLVVSDPDAIVYAIDRATFEHIWC